MRRLVFGSGFLIGATALIMSFQNCGVRRLAATSTGIDGVSNDLLSTAPTTSPATGGNANTAGSGATGSAGTTGGSSGAGSSAGNASTMPASTASSNTNQASTGTAAGSCTAAPVSPTTAPFVMTAPFKSQDGTISRFETAFLNKTDVIISASSACVTSGHTCTASTTTDTTCKSQKMSTLSISFRCSNDPKATMCDLITPGTVVNLAGTSSDASTKFLSISMQDTTDSCSATTTKSFLMMDLKTTYKNIGGTVTFNKVPSLAAGNRFELKLENVELRTQDGATVTKVNGTYFADISCVQSYKQ